MSTPIRMGVAAIGRAAFACADAAMTRAQLQRDLTAHGRPCNLKHADEQSLAGLLAIRDLANSEDLSDCGLIAAPQAPGRTSMTELFDRYDTGGPWAITPLIIPQCSLHSFAGLASIVFGITGPNLGVGGVAGREGEAWPIAASWLADGVVPGVVLVFTGMIGDAYRAVALSVSDANEGVATITWVPGDALTDNRQPATFTFHNLESALNLKSAFLLRARWLLPTGGSITWRNVISASKAAA